MINIYCSGLAEEVSGPLMLIFSNSWNSGEIPEHRKSANVVPIFTKGNQQDTDLYRPVSLSSVPGKKIEKLIWDSHRQISELADFPILEFSWNLGLRSLSLALC